MTSVTHAKVSAIADTGDTSLVRPSDWNAAHVVTITEAFLMSASDETSALTTGTGKITFRMPYAFTVSSARASLTTAQSTGSLVTVDIRKNGTSIFSTLITIDNGEKTSTTGTPSVLSTTALADDDEIRIDITQVGDGTAEGLKVCFIGTQ